MERFLEKKRALVTGATRGIGRAIAASLLDAGASVVVCGRNPKSVAETVKTLQPKGTVKGAVADVSQSDDVSNLFQFLDRELGGVDILINNAGIGIFKPAADLSIEDWKKTVDTNLSGVFYCSREALSRFRQNRDGGYVINISSLAGKNPFAGGSAYNASKFGLNGFSEAMMMDHRNDNVKVSYIMPGSVDTEFGGHGTGSSWKVSAQDIADIVTFLLRTPGRTLVSRVEVRPSRPKKD